MYNLCKPFPYQVACKTLQASTLYKINAEDFITAKVNKYDWFLQDPLLQHGWKTGAIIPELEDEIAQANEQVFKENLAEVLTVENLLQKRQVSYM